MSDPQVVATNTSLKPRPFFRVLRSLIAILAVVGVGHVIFCLVAIAGLYDMAPNPVVIPITAALPWLMLGATAWVIWRYPPLRVSLPIALGSAIFLTYLAWDCPPPPASPVLSPIASLNSKGYEAYRWMLKSDPGSRLKATFEPDRKLPHFSGKISEWSSFVRQHRETWEQAWTDDTLGREWIAAMAANSPDGVYPKPGPSTSLLSYSRVSATLRCHWARAQLLHEDGYPDTAAEILIAVLRTGYHLQRGAPTLTTQMTASAMTKGTYERLALLLADDMLTPVAKSQIIVALHEAPPIRENIALAFIGEEISARSTIARLGSAAGGVTEGFGGQRPALIPETWVQRLLFNANCSEREQSAYLRDLSRLAQDRQLGKTEDMRAFERQIERRILKNPVGRLLALMNTPVFEKGIESFWATDDLRIALLHRLEQER